MRENWIRNIIGEIMKNKILAIGPVTKDLIITPHEEYSQIGGAVYYQTMTLTQLKKDVISIITVGEDEVQLLNETLKKQKLIINKKTHQYTNTYDINLNRKQKAQLTKNSIQPQDIKISLSQIQYALISPLSPEDIPPETIRYLKEKDITTVLVAQGYLRQTDENNNIIKRKWKNQDQYLQHTDIICLDKEEALTAFNINNIKEETIQKIIQQYSLQQIIITLAEQGSAIYTAKETIHIPAIKTTEEIDATGLGDTYIAAYIAKLQETNDNRISGLFASITAKEKLKNRGPLKTSNKKIEEELDEYR